MPTLGCTAPAVSTDPQIHRIPKIVSRPPSVVESVGDLAAVTVRDKVFCHPRNPET
jgi:hypothetical protein